MTETKTKGCNMNGLTEPNVRRIFDCANIPIINLWELPNGYWPRATPEDWTDAQQVVDFVRYAQLREASPWFLVLTSLGLIKIGWRKRVLAIDWSATSLRTIVTADDVTKELHLVHAWSDAKAVGYLRRLADVANSQALQLLEQGAET